MMLIVVWTNKFWIWMCNSIAGTGMSAPKRRIIVMIEFALPTEALASCQTLSHGYTTLFSEK